MDAESYEQLSLDLVRKLEELPRNKSSLVLMLVAYRLMPFYSQYYSATHPEHVETANKILDQAFELAVEQELAVAIDFSEQYASLACPHSELGDSACQAQAVCISVVGGLSLLETKSQRFAVDFYSRVHHALNPIAGEIGMERFGCGSAVDDVYPGLADRFYKAILEDTRFVAWVKQILNDIDAISASEESLRDIGFRLREHALRNPCKILTCQPTKERGQKTFDFA